MRSGARRSTAPWSGQEIDLAMRQLIEARDDALNEYKAFGIAAAQAKNAYELAHAQKTLAARGLTVEEGDRAWTVAEKAAWVKTEVADLELAADIADAHWKAQRTVVQALESDADILRSLARSARDAYESPGSGVARR